MIISLIILISVVLTTAIVGDIVAAFTPVVTFGAIEAAKYMKKKISPKVIVYGLVPALSVLYTIATHLLADPEVAAWAQILLGLAAVWIHEVGHQYNPHKRG